MEFFSPEYNTAITHAVVYGLQVLLGMAVVGGVLTLVSGGPAALKWKKSH